MKLKQRAKEDDPTRTDIIIGPCRACGMDGTLDSDNKKCIRYLQPVKIIDLPIAYRPNRCAKSESKQQSWSSK
jgi:hypothetical protein